MASDDVEARGRAAVAITQRNTVPAVPMVWTGPGGLDSTEFPTLWFRELDVPQLMAIADGVNAGEVTSPRIAGWMVQVEGKYTFTRITFVWDSPVPCEVGVVITNFDHADTLPGFLERAQGSCVLQLCAGALEGIGDPKALTTEQLEAALSPKSSVLVVFPGLLHLPTPDGPTPNGNTMLQEIK